MIAYMTSSGQLSEDITSLTAENRASFLATLRSLRFAQEQLWNSEMSDEPCWCVEAWAAEGLYAPLIECSQDAITRNEACTGCSVPPALDGPMLRRH